MKRQLIFSIFPMLVLACSGKPLTDPQPPVGGGATPPESPAEVVALTADGNTHNTYALIVGSGYNYETPDASGEHAKAPFQHIQQSYDKTLKGYVFDFYLHIDSDDDRGLPNITDRQRNEIKTDAKSPAESVGQVDDVLVMKWKFLLPAGMKTTSNFCHVHQIKGIDNSSGTADVGNPLITFTARSLSNGKQQFQVIYVPPTAQGGGNQYLARVDLADFLGQWVEVEERILCGDKGTYQVSVKRVSDGRELVAVPKTDVAMWREGTTGMRPKWGIYRSFGAGGSLKPTLRDEMLRFADFSIEKEVR